MWAVLVNARRDRNMAQGGTDYSKICFVIMPFGKKKVAPPSDKKDGAAAAPAEKQVDFDALYSDIFLPAIGAVDLPEGGKLEPHRTDQDFFTGDIKQDMFDYLEYSRRHQRSQSERHVRARRPSPRPRGRHGDLPPERPAAALRHQFHQGIPL
jgi:hypothetical protein